MEETVFVDFDPTLNGPLAPNLQLCHAWEVVCTEEFTLPLTSSTQIEEVQQNSPNSEFQKAERDKTNTACPPQKKRNHYGTPLSSEKSNQRKSKRCSGEDKKLGPDCGCPIKCFKKIGEETIHKIFRDFWALADYNSQNAYLFGLINLVGVKRRYTKNETSRRNFTIVYHVKDRGRSIPVCKKAFLNIHGLQRNRGRINNLASKMKEGESVPPPDKRGRHKNRPNAYSQEAIEHVRKHLLRCPKIDRRKNISKTSKQMMFSTKRCYALYVNEYCKNNKLMPVSLDKFRRVFAMEGYKKACRGLQKSGD